MRIRIFSILILFIGAVEPRAEDVMPGFMSIYFDLEATVYERSAALFTPLPAHVILTESAFPEISGYEFGFGIDGSAVVTGRTFAGENPSLVDYGYENWGVALPAPMAVGSVTPLATFTLFLMGSDPIALTLSGPDIDPADIQDLPRVVLPDGTLQPVCCWGDEDGPWVCAMINGQPPIKSTRYVCTWGVPVERHSWDAVKSMYR